MKRIVERMAGQFGNPHGALAPVMALLLEIFNQPVNRRCIQALRIKPGDHVLDVGFGGGIGLARVIRHTPAGRVAGADISHEMVERCRRRFKGEISARRLELVEAPAEALPFPDRSFDAVYSVNSVTFWADRAAAFREILRVLAPGGRMAVAVDLGISKLLGQRAARLGLHFPTDQELRGHATAAGFANVDAQPLSRTSTVVVGRRSVQSDSPT